MANDDLLTMLSFRLNRIRDYETKHYPLILFDRPLISTRGKELYGYLLLDSSGRIRGHKRHRSGYYDIMDRGWRWIK